MENNLLTSNPFFILHASLSDDHAELQKKASEAILLGGSEDAEQALAVLFHPQKRLEAELNWFPDTSPEEIEVLRAFSENGGVLPDFQTGSTLALLNGCRCILTQWPSEYSEGLVGIGLCLAGALSELSENQILKELNSERKKSGFPEITNREVVANHVKDLRDEILGSFSKQLKEAKPGEAEKAASSLADAYCGNDPLYSRNYYIQKIVDSYMLTVTDQEEALLKDIKRATEFRPVNMDVLCTYLSPWDRISTPRRKIRKARGLTDQNSLFLFFDLNSFINARLKKDMRNGTTLISKMIEIFWDLPEEMLAQHKRLLQTLHLLK